MHNQRSTTISRLSLRLKEALGCEDNYVKAIISQLELAGIYGVQEACMVQDELYSALNS